MHCRNCGAEIGQENNFCHHCGARIDAGPSKGQAVPRPKTWFTWAFLLLLGLAIVAAYRHLTQEDLDKVIASQVNAIKNKHFTQAYYEYTSKEFQKSTSLETFRDFLKNNAFFADNKTLQVLSSNADDSRGKVKALLTATNGAEGTVLFHLIQEGSRWKIQYMQLEEGETADSSSSEEPLSEETKDILNPIDQQLKALQKKDISGAYEEPVSSDFKKQTPLDRFQAFVEQYPILTEFIQYAQEQPKITGSEADMTIILNPGQENTPLKYKLIKENGKWKIWGLQIVLPATGGAVNSLMHPKQLAPVIQQILEALHQKNVDEAYEKWTSSQFKHITDMEAFKHFLNQAPLLSSYTSYTIKNAFIENSLYGRVIVELKKGDEHVEALFSLEIEDGKWKVQGIQEKGSKAPPPEKKTSENPASNSLSFNPHFIGASAKERVAMHLPQQPQPHDASTKDATVL